MAMPDEPNDEPPGARPDAPRATWRRALFTRDHKVIGKQYLWASLVFLAIGGALAMVIRWQWAYPGEAVPILGNVLFSQSAGAVTPAAYPMVFTNHGLIMIFWAVTPLLLGAFGNFTIPLQIGARDMAFPALNMLSFWTFLASQVLVVASLLAPLGSAAAGWSMYPPLSGLEASPGRGQTLMLAALLVVGVSTLLGALNYVVTVIRCRAEGMTWSRLPLAVWGQWLTAILNLLFVPVLGAAALMLLLDRTVGTAFFSVGALGEGGDPLLYQHLFWIFGHPEVYILILPVWGIVGDLLSVFARKPAYWYRGTVGAMIAVTVLSGLVYGHHMYQTGMNPVLGMSFEVLTLAISFPAVVLFANWLMTLWRGSLRASVPMLFALGTAWVFGLGGLTGLALGAISTDIYLHDTLWVVGHFHLTMAAASFLGALAALHYWFPKMFGRRLSPVLGKVHFWGTVVTMTATFGLMHAAGYAGQHRRLYDPFEFQFLAGLADLNRLTSYVAFALGAFQLVFVVDFFRGVFAGPPAEANPWGAASLEWSVSSPPPHHNFAAEPRVLRGPHEYSNPRVAAALGRDWVGQAEVVSGESAAGESAASGVGSTP